MEFVGVGDTAHPMPKGAAPAVVAVGATLAAVRFLSPVFSPEIAGRWQWQRAAAQGMRCAPSA